MKELLRKVRKIEIKTRRLVNQMFAGEYHSAFKGQGLEFDEVRLYQYGDDIRSIDWNVTARTGEAHIKLFREERERSMFILFDVSGSEDFGAGEHNKLRVGTEIAAILAFSALQNQDKTALAIFSDRIERFFKPGKGRKHILAILRGLVEHQPESRGTDIGAAVDFFRKTQKRRSILILISDFIGENYFQPLKSIAHRHEIILIRLFHPSETFDFPSGLIPVRDAERNVLRWIFTGPFGFSKRAEEKFRNLNKDLLKFCSANRIDYATIDTSRDYVPQLENFFRKRNARTRIA